MNGHTARLKGRHRRNIAVTWRREQVKPSGQEQRIVAKVIDNTAYGRNTRAEVSA